MDADELLGMIHTSWPMKRSAYEKGWNEAIHAVHGKLASVSGPVDLRAAAPLLIRICNAMSRWESGLVTLPGTTARAGIGTVTATDAEFRALGALVDAARALIREEASDGR